MTSKIDEGVWDKLSSWEPRHVDPEKERVVQEALGWHSGRMLSGSKSGYRNRYPENPVVFNANLVVESTGKVWYGDVDPIADRKTLLSARAVIGEDLYFLYEHDARFDHENDPVEELIPRARFVVRENKIELMSEYDIEKHGKFI